MHWAGKNNENAKMLRLINEKDRASVVRTVELLNLDMIVDCG